MIISYTYKKFSIEYNSLTGTTIIYDIGLVIKKIEQLGYQKGEKKAKEYIDWLLENLDKGENL